MVCFCELLPCLTNGFLEKFKISHAKYSLSFYNFYLLSMIRMLEDFGCKPTFISISTYCLVVRMNVTMSTKAFGSKRFLCYGHFCSNTRRRWFYMNFFVLVKNFIFIFLLEISRFVVIEC